MSTMRSILASKRQHPSHSYASVANGQYEIPEPISHVHVLEQSPSGNHEYIAPVLDFAQARARLRPAS